MISRLTRRRPERARVPLGALLALVVAVPLSTSAVIGAATAAAVTSPEIAAYWESRDGAAGLLGDPTSTATPYSTANGDGVVQVFEGGYVYSSAEGVFTVKPGTPLANAWVRVGWIRGSLGWPVAEESCSGSVCTQQFQGGTIRGSTIVPSVTDPAIEPYWTGLDGADGVLGNPTGAVSTFTTPHGNGQVQVFQGGYVYSSAEGVFTVKPGTPLANAWVQAGWIRGSLGWPVAEESCSGSVCAQHFQGGTIQGSSVVPSVTSTQIRTYWESRDGAAGPLGDPMSIATSYSTTNGDGLVQVFQGGYVYSSSAGVFTVKPGTPLADAWVATGWIRGSLGWPVAEEVCASTGCSQQFQGGIARGEDEVLRDALVARISSLPGTYSVSVRELGGEGASASVRGTTMQEPASVMKLFVAYAILDRVDRGLIDLGSPTRSGVSVRDCLRVMLHVSDNLCHWDLVAMIGNQNLNDQFAAEGYLRTVYQGYSQSGTYYSSKRTTTDDVALLLSRLHRGELLSPEMTELFLGHLETQVWRHRIPAGAPSGTPIANKTGHLWVSTGFIHADTAIVTSPAGTYVVTVIGSRNATAEGVRAIGRTVYEYFNGPITSTASFSPRNLVTTSTVTAYRNAGNTPVATIPSGTRVEAYASARTWYQVRYNGSYVYVHSTHLRNYYDYPRS